MIRPGAGSMAPALATLLVLGCTATRIVPVPVPGVEIDAARATASVAAEGVELAAHASAWRGSPWDLDEYVTPFLLGLVNGAPSPVDYDYPSFRLFDDARFQYTALPPAEVERILRARAAAPDRLAAAGAPPPPRRRVAPGPYWPWWGWTPYGGYGWPWYYPGRPPLDDVYLRALAMGPLQPDARLEGFVYFPRIRPDARGLRLEFHHQVGGLMQVLTLSFTIDREKTRSG